MKIRPTMSMPVMTFLPSVAASSTVRALFDGWQLNGIATVNSGTPFTVSDSANVSLQANSPPISGFAASRPNLVGDPNSGPHTVDEWLSRSAFQRLDIQTQAGQFGNAGRNIARGPGYANIDVSIVRSFRLTRGTRLEVRFESFNVTNRVNLGLPIADLNSPNHTGHAAHVPGLGRRRASMDRHRSSGLRRKNAAGRNQR